MKTVKVSSKFVRGPGKTFATAYKEDYGKRKIYGVGAGISKSGPSSGTLEYDTRHKELALRVGKYGVGVSPRGVALLKENQDDRALESRTYLGKGLGRGKGR